MKIEKSIPVGKQDGVASLLSAFATALAAELGWETAKVSETGINVLHPSGNGGFSFFTNSSIVYVRAYLKGWNPTAYISTSWTSGYPYYLDVVRSGDTVAVGTRRSDGNMRIPCILAQNTNGEIKAINSGSNATTWNYIGSGLADIQTYHLPHNVSSSGNPAVSLVKAPDIWGGCMFKDLYVVYSTPFTDAVQLFSINGKYYRLLTNSSGGMGFALEVEK